jgi:dipeptidyl aminopeptidase/acylaminoacyl peptidase
MRRRFFLLLSLLVAPVFTTPLLSQTGGRAFQLSDWYRLTRVSAPAMSPDGKLVAFTVTTVKEAENKRHTEIWVVPTSGGEPMRYTSPGTESSDARWSPDGKYLFFRSNRPGGKGNTWVLRMDQPGGEASQMEGWPNGAMSSDGQLVIWADEGDAPRDTAKKDDPYAKMSAMARPPMDAITRPTKAERFDGRHIVDLSFKSNDAGFVPGRREPRTKKRLTSATYSHRSPLMSPDGKWIVFTADAELRSDSVIQAERDSLAKLPYDPRRDEVDRGQTDIFIIPSTGGEARRLGKWPGSESQLQWSPDGKRIAFMSTPVRMKQPQLYVVDVSADGNAAGSPRTLLDGWKNDVSGIRWLPDGKMMLEGAIGGRSALIKLDPATKQRTEILGGRRLMSGYTYDRAGTSVAYVSTSIAKPWELYIANIDGRNERQLTRFNEKLNSEITWSDAERFTYKSVGGLEIEGWLMKPYGYQPGNKYPLVLYIHGGPHSAYSETWFDEFQNLAAEGMWVLFTNPRGSSGYGAEFQYSTRGRWGDEDYLDLMKAVDIASVRPDVDSTKMGVTGGSYGGFMTAWITTRTNRFKAAQTDRMISNWFSWYGASDAQGLTEFEFFGKPWDNWKLYDELSPLKFAAKVNTPTLIVQSEEDFRTPMPEAEQWFVALKKRGIPVELVRYPRSTHELSRSGEPWLLVDRLGRLRQWFNYWLKGTRA